jgi:hypothetical protein
VIMNQALPLMLAPTGNRTTREFMTRLRATCEEHVRMAQAIEACVDPGTPHGDFPGRPQLIARPVSPRSGRRPVPGMPIRLLGRLANGRKCSVGCEPPSEG